jgi:3-dehydroquinate synthase
MIKTVTVDAPSKTYAVRIGSGLLDEAGRHAAGIWRAGRAVIVTDATVNALHADRLSASLRDADFDPVRYVFPAGEQSKNAATLIALLNFMAESRLTRTDTVFALGGGVVGDLAGLAASLYMRGIGLVQVPTTLLAAVDSSVGGKTAVDLEAGKNLCGTFYQPDLVLCDPGTLATLPAAEFANGCAEAIKYAVIRDARLLADLRPPLVGRMTEIIARCVSIKRDVVCGDERDTGERQLLNFGHTFGHAIEKCSGYTVPHGSAVAAGMALMTAACVKKGLCGVDCLGALLEALGWYGLPASCDYGESALYDAMLADKKRASDAITLVVPRSVGACELLTLTLPEAREFLKLGLEGETP